MKPFSLKYVISSKDAGKIIKQFLKEQQISKSALTDIKFKGGDIKVNGLTVTIVYVLSEGDQLEVIFPQEEASDSLVASDLPLSIIYEDDYILVVNKPPNMNTIPSREHPVGSLANALMFYYEKINLNTSPHIVTRLDRDTSGLVLIAKHRHIHHLFSLSQRKGLINREYAALATGNFQQLSGTIDAPIGRKEGSIIERAVTETGQFARTHFEVIKQYDQFAHVKLLLETGRTHQIRVHLSYIGHPLLGDDLYGGTLDLIDRQALHCSAISFEHPITNEIKHFTSELYFDMKKLLI